MKKPLHLAFIDVETGGLDHTKDALLEIAVLVVDGRDPELPVLRRMHSKVLPAPGKNINEEAAAINGYTPEVWREKAISLSRALSMFRETLSPSVLMDARVPCQWVGSNPKFDSDFLKVALEECGMTMPELASHHLLDIGSLCWPWVAEGFIESMSQRKLVKAFKIGDGEQRHRALDDVQQLIEIYGKAMPHLEQPVLYAD